MKFSENLSWAQFLIARHDEVEIEARLHWMLEDTDTDKRDLSQHWTALNMIEEAKLTGTYIALRAELRLIALKDGASLSNGDGPLAPSDMERRIADLENFTKGLRSDDDEERRAFQDFADKYGLMDRTPAEISQELAFARRVNTKGKRGAKSKIPTWRDMIMELDAMRIAVAGGCSVPEAARKAAASSAINTSENFWKTLERAFIKRRKFRDNNSD